MVVTATTLLLKSYARVHDWASKGTSLGGRACLSSWLFSLLRCKMSLILPKRLYGVTALKSAKGTVMVKLVKVDMSNLSN